MSKEQALNLIFNYFNSQLANGFRIDSGMGVEYFHCHCADVICGYIIGCSIDKETKKINFLVDMTEYRYDGQCRPSKEVKIGQVLIPVSKVNKDEVIGVCKLLKLI
jgi:hypothetical protein